MTDEEERPNIRQKQSALPFPILVNIPRSTLPGLANAPPIRTQHVPLAYGLDIGLQMAAPGPSNRGSTPPEVAQVTSSTMHPTQSHTVPPTQPGLDGNNNMDTNDNDNDNQWVEPECPPGFEFDIGDDETDIDTLPLESTYTKLFDNLKSFLKNLRNEIMKLSKSRTQKSKEYSVLRQGLHSDVVAKTLRVADNSKVKNIIANASKAGEALPPHMQILEEHRLKQIRDLELTHTRMAMEQKSRELEQFNLRFTALYKFTASFIEANTGMIKRLPFYLTEENVAMIFEKFFGDEEVKQYIRTWQICTKGEVLKQSRQLHDRLNPLHPQHAETLNTEGDIAPDVNAAPVNLHDLQKRCDAIEKQNKSLIKQINRLGIHNTQSLETNPTQSPATRGRGRGGRITGGRSNRTPPAELPDPPNSRSVTGRNRGRAVTGRAVTGRHMTGQRNPTPSSTPIPTPTPTLPPHIRANDSGRGRGRGRGPRDSARGGGGRTVHFETRDTTNTPRSASRKRSREDAGERKNARP